MQNKCTILPKCPAETTNSGLVEMFHATKDLSKLPPGFKVTGSLDEEYSFVQGNLCCYNNNTDYVPKNTLFYSDKCPANSTDLGNSKLNMDYNDISEKIIPIFTLGSKNDNSIWAYPKLCRANQNIQLNDNIFIHGSKCDGIWQNYSRSGFLMQDSDIRKKKFPSKGLFTGQMGSGKENEWWWVNPKLCQINSSINTTLKKCQIKKETGEIVDPTPECDDFMLDHCSKNKTAKECSCINSKLTNVGSPICIDQQCVDYGYKTTGMTKFKCDQFVTPFKCSQYYDLKNQYSKDLVQLVNNKYTQSCLSEPQPFQVENLKPQYSIDPKERQDNFIFYLVGIFILFIFSVDYFYRRKR